MILFVLPTAIHAQTSAEATAVAFIDVNVIPRDRDRVLAHQTVLVRDGRIVALGPVKRVSVPEGTVRVDGKDKFLLPGLADMRFHLPGSDSVEPTPKELEFAGGTLLQALAYGITTVRNMRGSPWHLSLRARAQRGELLSPRIYTAGPYAEPAEITTPEAAVRIHVADRARTFSVMGGRGRPRSLGRSAGPRPCAAARRPVGGIDGDPSRATLRPPRRLPRATAHAPRPRPRGPAH